jgi:hypothetical protein
MHSKDHMSGGHKHSQQKVLRAFECRLLAGRLKAACTQRRRRLDG